MPENRGVSAIEEYVAVKAMMETKGWMILQGKLATEGEDIMSAILDVATDKDERELKLRELVTFRKIPEIIEQMKFDAEREASENKDKGKE